MLNVSITELFSGRVEIIIVRNNKDKAMKFSLLFFFPCKVNIIYDLRYKLIVGNI